MKPRLFTGLCIGLLLLLGAFGVQLSGCATDTASPNSGPSQALSGSQTPAVVVCVRGLVWSDISKNNTPTLYDLSINGSVANLASNSAWPENLKAAQPDVALYRLTAGADGDLSAVDTEVNRLLKNSPLGTRLIVAALPVTSADAPHLPLAPLIATGIGLEGYLQSSTTHRIGLLAGTDIVDYLASSKVILSAHPAPSTAERLAFLQHNVAICNAVEASREYMGWAFLTLFMLTLAVSLVLSFFEIDMNPRSTRWLVPLTRVLILVVLAYPVSTFLMFIIPPPLYALTDSTGGLTALSLFWTIMLTVIALIIGKRTLWSHSLFFLFIVTSVVILADQLLAGPLSLTGYLNYHANEGIRYYGLGNEASALLFGSWLTFSGLVVNRFPNARLTPHFKRWGFLAASALITAICAVPQIGASFGVLTWGVVGVVIAWWLFAERPLRPRFIIATICGAALLAIGVLMADLAFSPFPHMPNMDSYLQGGPLALLLGVFNEISAYSWATIVYSPPLTAIFDITVLWLFALALVKPGSYKEFWARNRGLRAVYTAGLAIIVLMCCLEDSGIFMPALYLSYLMAGFIWLVCDMHTWRSRVMQASGKHITLRELMRLALDQETYRGRFGDAPVNTAPTVTTKVVEEDEDHTR
ncbi:MAG: hypothetical protein LBP28_03665 [Coriobacteriales bacterium]|jgi:hypothetical protein|nr:hypothetical protein [Coriobacteriales bacterium]